MQPPPVASYRPRAPALLTVVALLLLIGLGAVASRHKAAQDSILGEQQQLLGMKSALARIERLILLARNEEATLLLRGGSAPIAGFEARMHEVGRAWHELMTNPAADRISGELEVFHETIERYRQAVEGLIRILRRIGRAGEPGLLDALEQAETTLSTLFRQQGNLALSLRFADLQVRERDFSATLNIEHAETLLRDTEALARRVEALPSASTRPALLSAITSYREDVATAMASVLELELTSSQSALRLRRVSPATRALEDRLDAALRTTAEKLQHRRRVATIQSVSLMIGVLVVFLLLLIVEVRRARDWVALESGIQQSQKLESLGVLTGGIAHDFNNLLVGVLGNAGLALAELPRNATIRPYLEGIETAARRAAELVNQMLAYAGKTRFLVGECNLSALVLEMLQLLRSSISSRAHLELALAEDLPLIDADVTQIRQVIMNLITNASDSLEAGRGRIVLSTGIEEVEAIDPEKTTHDGPLAPGSYVYLQVEDTGTGMDEVTRRKLFEPFFTTKFAGRGLGMAAVLGIVRGHGGAITVQSKAGWGSTFRVRLPITQRQSPAEAPAERERPVTTLPPNPGTVLVIDDEEIVRLLAQHGLGKAGFRVLVAADGQSGIDVFKQHADAIDLVLLDLTMPGLDGEETLRELCNIRPDVQVILSSGHPEENSSELNSSSAVVDFLSKPYSPARLLQRVSAAIVSPRTPAEGLLTVH